MLPRHARCVLSRLRCNGHSLLLSSNLSRIGRIENPSCSPCGHSSQHTSHLILHCPATDSLRRSLFGDSLVQILESFPDSGAPWSPTMPPSLGRGRVINNNNKFLQSDESIVHLQKKSKVFTFDLDQDLNIFRHNSHIKNGPRT